MKIIGNILWFIFGGFINFLLWSLVGILWCITIVGIPVGTQCFKFAKLSLNPFGKKIINEGGAGSLLLNILWLIFGGFELALTFLIEGLLLFCTIIGIPFALQQFKFTKLALFPFGAQIIEN